MILEVGMGLAVAGKAIIAAMAISLGASTGSAMAQTELKVVVFAGMSNLAQFAAEAQGFFKKRGLAVELINTPNSTELRRGLAEGRYHIAHGGVDNAVAQVENDKTDLFVFMGGNSGLNSLFVQPEITSYDQLRGKTMAVDSPNTAFALLLYKMLDVKGIKRNEYEVKPVGATHLRLQAMLKDKTFAAGMLSPPGSVQAARAGLKDFGSAVSVVGPYQSDAGWVLRSWGKANEDVLVRYIQANIEGIRWALDPANRPALIALVAQRLKQPTDIVTESMKIADAQKGYAVDARFDLDGFRNVLKLRAEMLGTWGGTPPAPDKYLDLSYYDRALKGL
jgi:ABC-type nitrate/sulfonate/bicarbonate transport system substrate-binding protein